MKRILHAVEAWMDDFKIKNKFYILYILCVLVPLIVTDSAVFSVVMKSEREAREHEMANIANAVAYSISNTVNNAAEIGKSIYTSKYINRFLANTYSDPLDYVVSYQDFFKDTLFESGLGMNNMVITMYVDNDTIVNGGKVCNMKEIRGTEVYRYFQDNGLNKGLYFQYDDSRAPSVEPQRRMLFFQKLDFYAENNMEKVLLINIDYSAVNRTLEKMNYDTDVFICQGDKIVLSNGRYSSIGKEFQTFDQTGRVGYCQELEFYGMDLDIYVMQPKRQLWTEIRKNLPLIGFLIVVNAILPLLLVRGFNRSFTQRISELSKVFETVGGEHLVPISYVRGKDEIGSLMSNYNRMVARTNELIQIVYKNKIKEQEMLVERQNAELLALHSQINPHFLFNALESIRMRSLLKEENETADMVEKLAIMQRQYVDWGNDSVEIEQELEFVKAYLSLQKYRFGDRLNYNLEIDPECAQIRIPKLTIVTFVENACVHGIESKASPGWIFVRAYKREEQLYIEIEDTGSGIEEQKLYQMQHDMQNADIEMLKNKKSVGMLNACLRLKMYTEDHVCFEIEGEEGVGTWITICIPMEYLSFAEGCVNGPVCKRGKEIC